ncbi:hypothetical protein SUGI_0223980 [Cryptomeria japonica]|uniref:EP1-like glycoprotein 2 n=1 Tax=Cryptomeria japonica TaxID=3369 RepID=UPI002408E0D0|nr:EP1-like glycoprotein 2 [Cryptomeria japonica]GLJ14010.1 hypothetical protein SUGI_0223980 [Cryptomeria japonica]
MDRICKLLFLLVVLVVCVEVEAESWDQPFSYVNGGELGEYTVEYGASYRSVPLSSVGGIFQLAFFNTTPNAYTLAIRMGYYSYAETMRFVWTPNRHHLVSEKATLNFTRRGDLVLFDADGTLVWSTNTANKGVVGVELRSNGNMVLYDKKNRTVWQSFDYPTDSLLVGQSLDISRVKKLVSRTSEKDGSEGPYSLEMEAGGFALYASLPNPLPYWTLSFYDNERKDLFSIKHTCERPVASITFLSDPEARNGFRQIIEMQLSNTSAPAQQRAPELCNLTSQSTVSYGFNFPRFNTTLSFLRLDWDGNLRIYTYSPDVEGNTWDITYERFKSGEGIYGCGPPKKCGSLGVCQDSSCVACPQPDGVKAWSPKCSPPKLPACSAKNSSSLDFYKLVGVDHFSKKYAPGIGKLTVVECKRRCLSDCKCAAFFYWQESSTCFLTQSLYTLHQLGNSTHLAFIKYAKNV